MVPHLFQKMEFPQKGDIHIFSFLLYLNLVITPYLLPFLTAALYWSNCWLWRDYLP